MDGKVTMKPCLCMLNKNYLGTITTKILGDVVYKQHYVHAACWHLTSKEAVDEDHKLFFAEMANILTLPPSSSGARGIPVPQAIPQEDQLMPTIKVSSDTLGSSIRPPQ